MKSQSPILEAEPGAGLSQLFHGSTSLRAVHICVYLHSHVGPRARATLAPQEPEPDQAVLEGHCETVRSNRTLQGLKPQLRNIGNRNLTAYVASSDFGGAKAASETAFGQF